MQGSRNGIHYSYRTSFRPCLTPDIVILQGPEIDVNFFCINIVMSIYSDTFQKNQYNLVQAAQRSQTWFQQQARLLTKQSIQPMRLINSEPERNRFRVVPGELYLFMYDAKMQDELPYWDMFPLVFPFRKLKDGFIGLNMHYLPYKARVTLLSRLMDFKTNRLMNENTRLKCSWGVINGLSRYSFAKHCVHRYLANHLQTPLKKIDASDWATAMMLPVERFVGASKQQVWSESFK